MINQPQDIFPQKELNLHKDRSIRSAKRHVTIRKYRIEDRPHVRRISCETAFLELPRGNIFTDDEVLADALVSSYVDFEPESCYVADMKGKVVGYIIGSLDLHNHNQISSKTMLPLFMKALQRGVFLRKANLKFFIQSLQGALKGEFVMPNFTKEFPATLHINVKHGYRREGVGKKLLVAYLDYLKNAQVKAVHMGTISEIAKDFFVSMGFRVIYQSPRTYLKVYLGKEVTCYVLGKEL
ncbi:MAG: GNAT family N-acetyltransferase [Candidatus Omnitrophica bacterium]|nr:GNAT family N-acetyltransferase [Candidatus Omnitrophota bacterium]